MTGLFERFHLETNIVHLMEYELRLTPLSWPVLLGLSFRNQSIVDDLTLTLDEVEEILGL